MSTEFPRRTAVGMAACAAVCAGCTRYGAPGAETPTPTQVGAEQVLGLASAVPVGGGKVFKEQEIVVTQAVAGQFAGFSAICTHQGCVVSGVAEGVITCDCHGSKFTLDGAVATGPATTPLPPVSVSVNGNGELVVGAAPATTEPSTTEPPTTEPPTTEAPTTTEAPAGGPALAATADVPVGGGTVLADQEIVLTQPSEGQFLAFSAVCTHQGCIVGNVDGGTINCECHGSKFGLDGSVVTGPASTPLSARAVKVIDDQISLA